MRKVFLAALVLFMAGNVWAQKNFHIINFCNTLDPDIGCEDDYYRTQQEASLIASYLGYEARFYLGEGENCSKEKLMETLQLLKCEKDDIIFFYYSGHGTRSTQDQSEFPQMCLKYQLYDEDKFVAVHTVVEELKKKNARFTLVMTDCCNSTNSSVSVKSLMSKDGGSIVDDETVARNYRKLFVDNPGIVVVTSSRKGQPSLGGSGMGGLFSKVFFEDGLYSVGKGTLTPTWEALLKDVSGTVTALAAQTKDKTKQEPIYTIDMNNSSNSAGTTVTIASNNHPTPVIAVNSDFAKDLATLLDASRTEEWRVNQAHVLAYRYFTSDAKVATVGRNGSTVIEYESARDFLQRIALSKLISKMNVIKEMTDSTGKRNYIKVQEIRKPK